MTDYMARLHGVYASGDAWSTGLRISSNQVPDALLTTFSAAWIAAWTDGTHGLSALYHTSTTTTGFTVAALNGSMKEVSKLFLADAHAGTSSDTALPERDAVVVSLRSTYIQKFGRGRMFLPAPVEGIVVTGEYTSAAMTRVKAAITALFAAIQADGSTVFVTNLHALKDGTPPYRKTVITSLMVARKPGSQERRTDRQAPNYV